jgi:alkylhydroperoxidase family enzyme
VIANPRALSAAPRMQMLAELTVVVTEAPWALSRMHRDRAHEAGLGDEDILHAIQLSSYFGHLNRIADAVAVPLDYVVQHMPPATDPSVAPWPAAPSLVVGRPALEASLRPATATALAAWRTYMFDRDAPLARRQRTVIARWVATWLGDGGISPPDDLTFNPLDDALRELAEQITLAPWKLCDASFASLRAVGFDDAALFDACAVASTTGVFSRITVALSALGRERS